MKDWERKKMENHLLAAQENTAPKCRVYNGDKADVDMEEYTRQMDSPAKHRGGLGWLLAVLLLSAGLIVYILTGGKLPWN